MCECFEFNAGIDCEDVSRWRKMLPGLSTGAQRGLFTEREHEYCNSYSDPAPHYAARWCAKEAVLKSFSPFFKLDIRSVEVLNDEDGRPICIFNDPRIDNRSVSVRLSISHSVTTAVAIALLKIHTSCRL